MKTAALFLWLLVPLGAWAVYETYGTPHLVVSYIFTGGSRYDPFADRYYHSCTYFGWTGQRTVPAIDGRCPWIRFFHGGRGQ